MYRTWRPIPDLRNTGELMSHSEAAYGAAKEKEAVERGKESTTQKEDSR